MSYDSVPSELKALPRWVCWKIEMREGKPTKVPYQPNGHKADPTKPPTWSRAACTKPTTWGTFQQATAAVPDGKFNGIGFVLCKEDGYTGIDLDKCRNPQTGVTEPWALEIIAELDSYTELSPSKCGWHIFVKGNLPVGSRNRVGRVEMYDTARYLTITGQWQINVGGEAIESRNVSSLQKRMVAGTLEPKQSKQLTVAKVPVDDSAEDWALIAELQKQVNAPNADKLEEAFRDKYPERYESRNREKRNRDGGTKTYFAYTIARFFAQKGAPNVTPNGDDTELDLVRASDVKPESYKWLWKNKFALGELNSLNGPMDVGKSTVAFDTIARVTTGRDFYDAKNELGGPRDVLMLISEDSIKSTVVPRLMAAAADLTHIQFVKQTIVKKGANKRERMFALDTDLKALERELDKNPNIKIVYIDPLAAYLGKVRKNAEEEMRGAVLTPFKDLAERKEVCVLIIDHYNKNAAQAAVHRVSGSQAVVAGPRVAWSCIRDEGEQEKTIEMVALKLNIVAEEHKTGLKYRFVTVEVPIDGKMHGYPTIDWCGTTNKTADQLLAKATFDPEASKVKQAEDFYTSALANGPRLSFQLLNELEELGIGKDTAKRARKNLGLQAKEKRDEERNRNYWWTMTKEQAEEWDKAEQQQATEEAPFCLK